MPLPTVLVRGLTSEDDPDKRLLPWDEAVQGTTQALAATALNRLHDALRNLTIKSDGSTEDGVKADFLGVTGIGSVATTFYLEVNPDGLLKDVGTNEPILRASGEAVFRGGFSSPLASGAADAAVGIEVELAREGGCAWMCRSWRISAWCCRRSRCRNGRLAI